MSPEVLEAVAVIGSLPVYALAFYGAGLLLFANGRKELSWREPLLLGGLAGISVLLAKGLTIGSLQLAQLMLLASVGVMQFVYKGRIQLFAVLRSPGRLGLQLLAGYGLFAVTALIGWGMAQLAEALGGSYGDPRIAGELAQSPWPVLTVLAAPFAPALMEELVYRRFAAEWLQRWIRSPWVIALLSSMVWAGAHLSGDVNPWYLPLIEFGLLAGPLSFWVYRRFGLFSVIAGHYLHNSFLYVRGTEDPWMFAVLLLPLGLLAVSRVASRTLHR